MNLKLKLFCTVLLLLKNEKQKIEDTHLTPEHKGNFILHHQITGNSVQQCTCIALNNKFTLSCYIYSNYKKSMYIFKTITYHECVVFWFATTHILPIQKKNLQCTLILTITISINAHLYFIKSI